MRTRHPFADIEEDQPLPASTVGWAPKPSEFWPLPKVTTVVSPAEYASLEAELSRPRMHSGENRRQRRAAVATFAGPKELGPTLRRDLLEKRQAKSLGTLDPALRRLQRKALSK